MDHTELRKKFIVSLTWTSWSRIVGGDLGN